MGGPDPSNLIRVMPAKETEMKDEDKGMSALGCGLVWFGAAVSIAEIEAGRSLAPAAVDGRGLTEVEQPH